MQVPRVIMPGSAVESWTVVDTVDWSVVDPVDRFLAHLTAVERSPQTVPGWTRPPAGATGRNRRLDHQLEIAVAITGWIRQLDSPAGTPEGQADRCRGHYSWMAAR